MKKKIFVVPYILIVLLLLVVQVLPAQPPPPPGGGGSGGGPGCWPEPCPIDNNIVVLMAAGLGLVIYFVYAYSRKKEMN